MSYRVHYPTSAKLRVSAHHRSLKLALTGILGLFILICIGAYYKDMHFLLWDHAATAAAFHDLGTDIRNDVSMIQAFANFCRTVLHGI